LPASDTRRKHGTRGHGERPDVAPQCEKSTGISSSKLIIYKKLQ
jgi:hypothetical protein